MIVRVQFVESSRGMKKIIHSWCLFSLNQNNNLKEIFYDIYDKKISCGREIDLGNYVKDEVCASTLVTTEKCPTDLMPTPLRISASEIKEDNTGSLYLEYKLKLKSAVDTEAPNSNDPVTTSSVTEPKDTIQNVLMNRFDHYVPPKTTGKYGDVKQFNALINFVRENKFGVQGSTLEDFGDFILLFSSLLWEIDPHYAKIREHGGGDSPLLSRNYWDLMIHRLTVIMQSQYKSSH